MEANAKTSATLSFSSGTLVLSGWSAAEVRVRFGDGAWTWDGRISAWRRDGLDYAAVRGVLDDHGAAVDDDVPAWQTVEWPSPNLVALREEQSAAVAAWQRSGRGMIVMPTGTGKTEVALRIVRDAAVSTLVVAPVRDLMYQWHRRILQRLGYDAGIVGDRVFRLRRVSVTTYDSAYIHMEKLGNRFGLVVFDECHHLPGPLRQDAARMCAAPQRLGLTATLERSDGRESLLEALIGPVVYDVPIAAARGKTLAEYDVVRIPVHLSDEEQYRYERLSRQVREFVSERRKADAKITWEDICAESATTPEARHALAAYRAKKSIEDRAEEKLRILEDLFRLHADQPCIVFAGSNAMARDVSRRFLIPCLLSHCRKEERREILDGLEGGTYRAIVANQVLDEGVDLPEVKVAIVIGGMASSRQAKQRLGRILRRSGAKRATLYEIVTAGTNEEARSRSRRKSDAYDKTRHRRATR